LDIKEQKKIIGTNIRRYRDFKGWNQEALGKEVGIEKATISRIETGVENVSIDTLLKIVNALDVCVEEICLKDIKAVSFKFILSENNVQTLFGIIEMIKDILDKKEK
jgi:transcriptional regulator with XRE-family HTH domain